jgi:curved DNA-binding protein CbpA
MDRVSGVLSLLAPGGTSEVYLKDGHPVAVELPGALDRLGGLLVAAGALEPARFKQSLATPVPAGSHYGRMLYEQGVITREQLLGALRLQLRRRLHRLFFLEEASFIVEPRAHDRGVEAGESVWVDPRRAIYQGVRSAWSEARFGATLAAVANEPLRLLIAGEALAAYGIKGDDARLITLLGERPRRIAELVADSGLQLAVVQPLIYTLLSTDAVQAGSPRSSLTDARDETLRSPRSSLAAGSEAGDAAGRPEGQRTPRPGAARREPTTDRLLAIPDGPAPPVPSSAEMLEDIIRRKAAAVDKEDFFAVLGLTPSAGKAEIRSAYIASAKLYHPDRVTAAGLAALRDDAERVFRRVSEAHATLMDDNRRAAYLARGKETTPAGAPDANRVLAAEMAFLEGDVAFKRRDFARAQASLQRSVELNPQEGEAVALLAWVRLCAGQAVPPEVRKELERAIKMSPRCARAYYYLGMVLKQQDEVERAIASFRKASDLDERLTEAQSELRVLALRHGKKPDSSRSLFDRFKKK